MVDPCSKRAFADWWRTTAADRFTKIPASALDHRRFWDAFHAVPLDALPRIEEKLALAACARLGLGISSVALDMTNFATFIDTGNARAPIAQRGKAKQKRADLRLVGLGLVITRTAASRCFRMPTPAASLTSPSSRRCSRSWPPGTPPWPPQPGRTAPR